MTISNEKDNSRQEDGAVEPAELALYFHTRSQGAWRNADNPANSPRTRLLRYFDAGDFSILAALNSELPLTLHDGLDFTWMLGHAREKLGLIESDVQPIVSFRLCMEHPSALEMPENLK